MNYPVLWIVLLVAFAGIEGLTAGLVSIWFCVGSIVALIAAFLKATLFVQIGLFAVVSVAAMALIRPFARKIMTKPAIKTNADRILGEEGVVLETIDNLHATGQVKVGGTVWTARSLEGEVIPKDSLVLVDHIEGVKAIVTIVKKGEL